MPGKNKNAIDPRLASLAKKWNAVVKNPDMKKLKEFQTSVDDVTISDSQPTKRNNLLHYLVPAQAKNIRAGSQPIDTLSIYDIEQKLRKNLPSFQEKPNAAIFCLKTANNKGEWVAFDDSENSLDVYLYDESSKNWKKADDRDFYLKPDKFYNLSPDGLTNFQLAILKNENKREQLIQAFHFGKRREKRWFFMEWDFNKKAASSIREKFFSREPIDEKNQSVILYRKKTAIDGNKENIWSYHYTLKNESGSNKKEKLWNLALTVKDNNLKADESVIRETEIAIPPSVLGEKSFDKLLAVTYSRTEKEAKDDIRNTQLAVDGDEKNGFSLSLLTLTDDVNKLLKDRLKDAHPDMPNTPCIPRFSKGKIKNSKAFSKSAPAVTGGAPITSGLVLSSMPEDEEGESDSSEFKDFDDKIKKPKQKPTVDTDERSIFEIGQEVAKAMSTQPQPQPQPPTTTPLLRRDTKHVIETAQGDRWVEYRMTPTEPEPVPSRNIDPKCLSFVPNNNAIVNLSEVNNDTFAPGRTSPSLKHLSEQEIADRYSQVSSESDKLLKHMEESLSKTSASIREFPCEAANSTDVYNTLPIFTPPEEIINLEIKVKVINNQLKELFELVNLKEKIDGPGYHIHKEGFEKLLAAKEDVGKLAGKYVQWKEIFDDIENAYDGDKNILNPARFSLDELEQNLKTYESIRRYQVDELSYYDEYPSQPNYKPFYAIPPTDEKPILHKNKQDMEFTETSTEIFVRREHLVKKVQYDKKEKKLHPLVYELIVDSLRQHRKTKAWFDPLYLRGDKNLVAATAVAAELMNFQQIKISKKLNIKIEKARNIHTESIKKYLANGFFKEEQKYKTLRDEICNDTPPTTVEKRERKISR